MAPNSRMSFGPEQRMRNLLAVFVVVMMLATGFHDAPAGKPSTASSGPETPAGPSVSVGDAKSSFLVAPTRVVFESSRRAAELMLMNTGPRRATFRISLIAMRMSETGAIAEAVDTRPGEAVADRLLRYSPRQVTLEPCQSQTIRVQVRKPADLGPGEYRSHLIVRAIPQVDTTVAPNPSAAGSDGINVEFTPIYGIAVPLIVRHGPTSAVVAMDQVQVRPGAEPDSALELRLALRRSGNRSVYGNLIASSEEAFGRTRVVGVMKGLAVYVPNSERHVVLRLDPSFGTRAKGQHIHVVFENAEGPKDVLAESELVLP